MQDAWRAYLELALGLTEAPRKRAQTVARRLVGTGGATAAQLQALVEEMVSTGLANREALTKIVRSEVDRAMGAVGLATAEEVAELTARVRQLEKQLSELATRPGVASPMPPTVGEAAAAGAGPAGSVAREIVADRAVGQKAVAKRVVAKKTVAKKVVAKKTVAKKAVAQKTTDREQWAGGAEAE